ncbi:MAG: phosphate/phosphite/phosphonate ABC transporter substrate-binding protein [Acidobacteria bacterium]|nr:MAG: phosphate/phosphite/phosphonate ABC transporter substrate-binding protein [Acidobacteriota bacterium]
MGCRRQLRTALLLWAAAALVALGAAPECPHGQLDSRYCDTDGDLVADPPADPSAWKDPPVLVFAYTPVEDPALYRRAWQPFLDHLSAATGRRVVYFPVQSNAAEIEAMRAGRLHVAGFNTGSVPLAVNAAGFVPVAMMARQDGSFGYRMLLITRADGPIADVAGLRGHEIAFTSPTSNSGAKAPRALLKAEFGLEEGKDYRSTYSGKHDNSILGVAHGDYDAAAVASTVLDRMAERGVVDRRAFRVLYASQPFPTTAFGYAHDLAPELARKIREAFFTFDWTGTELLREFAGTAGSRFVPVDYRKHWEVIRRIDAANGVRYTSWR